MSKHKYEIRINEVNEVDKDTFIETMLKYEKTSIMVDGMIGYIDINTKDLIKGIIKVQEFNPNSTYDYHLSIGKNHASLDIDYNGR